VAGGVQVALLGGLLFINSSVAHCKSAAHVGSLAGQGCHVTQQLVWESLFLDWVTFA
jgi:hypothetical protein